MRAEVRPASLLLIDAFKPLVRDVARTATVLKIEHNMDVVIDLAHRITVLDFGRILAEGTPTEVRADKAMQAAYLGVRYLTHSVN